jgi:hypothetical protein
MVLPPGRFVVHVSRLEDAPWKPKRGPLTQNVTYLFRTGLADTPPQRRGEPVFSLEHEGISGLVEGMKQYNKAKYTGKKKYRGCSAAVGVHDFQIHSKGNRFVVSANRRLRVGSKTIPLQNITGFSHAAQAAALADLAGFLRRQRPGASIMFRRENRVATEEVPIEAEISWLRKSAGADSVAIKSALTRDAT